MKLSTTQTATIAASLALLPYLSVLGPAYGLYSLSQKDEAGEEGAVIAGYNANSLGKISLVSLVWMASASHNYGVLAGTFFGVLAMNTITTGSLPQAEYSAIKDVLTSAIEKLQAFDISLLKEDVQAKFVQSRDVVIEFYSSAITKAKSLTSPKETVEDTAAIEPTIEVFELSDDWEESVSAFEVGDASRFDVVESVPFAESSTEIVTVSDIETSDTEVSSVGATNEEISTDVSTSVETPVKKTQKVSVGFGMKTN